MVLPTAVQPDKSGQRLSTLILFFVVAMSVASTCTVVDADQVQEVAPQATERLPTSAQGQWDTSQQALASYISERWKVDRSAAQNVVAMTNISALHHNVDPLLVLAVVARESAFRYAGNHFDQRINVQVSEIDPDAPHGLMQIAGAFHPEKMPVGRNGQVRVSTDEENIHIGTQILVEYLERERGNEVRALQRYNGSIGDETRRFSRYVLKVREDFRKVARDA